MRGRPSACSEKERKNDRPVPGRRASAAPFRRVRFCRTLFFSGEVRRRKGPLIPVWRRGDFHHRLPPGNDPRPSGAIPRTGLPWETMNRSSQSAKFKARYRASSRKLESHHMRYPFHPSSLFRRQSSKNDRLDGRWDTSVQEKNRRCPACSQPPTNGTVPSDLRTTAGKGWPRRMPEKCPVIIGKTKARATAEVLNLLFRCRLVKGKTHFFHPAHFALNRQFPVHQPLFETVQRFVNQFLTHGFLPAIDPF